jgi:hypothetical protein
LRSQLELDAFCEEVSALADKKTIYQYYKQATEEPFSFLYRAVWRLRGRRHLLGSV